MLGGEHRDKVTVMAAHALASPADGKTPVHLLNLSAEPAMVYRGTKIAHIEAVEGPDTAGATAVEQDTPSSTTDAKK